MLGATGTFLSCLFGSEVKDAAVQAARCFSKLPIRQ